MDQDDRRTAAAGGAAEIARCSGPRGMRFRLRRAFAEQAGAGLLECLLDPGAAGARLLKENPRRSVYRLETAAGPLIVKHYRPGGRGEALKTLLFGGRARREWSVAERLRRAGLPSVEAVALGERPTGGWPGFALFAVRAVPDAVPLGGFLEARASSGEESRAERRLWLGRAVALLAALHSRCFDHRDFHGGNLLVEGGAGGAGSSLVVVDLHRVAMRGRVRDGRRQAALALLLYTLRFAIDREDAGFAVAEYLAAAGRDASAAGAWQEAVRRALARLEARRVQSRGKRCLRESTLFTRVQAGGVRGFRRRAAAEPRLFAAVEEARAALAGGGAAVRSLARRSSVALARLGDAGVAVKVYEQDGWRRGRPGRGRAGRACLAAHGLAVRGVAVPGVVAWLRTPDRSFLIVDEVRGALPLSVFSWRAAPGGDLAGLLAGAAGAVAALLSSLFACGARVHDLSPKNILLAWEEGRPRAFLCDFDGVSFSRPPARAGMLRGLAQVNDLAPAVGLRARLMVLRALRRENPALRGREVAHAIARHTAERAAKRLGAAAPGALLAGGEA